MTETFKSHLQIFCACFKEAHLLINTIIPHVNYQQCSSSSGKLLKHRKPIYQ